MPVSTVALRRLLASHRPSHSRDGYPDHVRREVVRRVRPLHAAGRSVTALSRDLGLAAATLRRWLASDVDVEAAPRGFVPVLVARAQPSFDVTGVELLDKGPAEANSGARLALVTPGGYRVLGLDLDAVRSLLSVLP